MIDWVTAEIPCVHAPLPSDRVCKISADGEMVWETPCRVAVTGSYDAAIQVRSVGGDGQGMATHLNISGNPSKFLQGHNIFGSDNLTALVYDTFLRICRVLELTPTLDELRQVKAGRYRVTRVDINYSFELLTRADVLSWLREAEFKSKTRHGRPSTKGGTVYWGKSSKRWAIKAYSKGEEITAPKHQLPKELQHTPLTKWADNKLRVELVLRSKELDKIGLSEAQQWQDETAEAVFKDYIGRLQMSEQMQISDEKMNALPANLRSTYVLWRDGHDLRSTLPKRTYYRHRKELMAYGINIDLAREKNKKSNSVPLLRVLEAKRVEIPEWAFTLNLVHASTERTALRAVGER